MGAGIRILEDDEEIFTYHFTLDKSEAGSSNVAEYAAFMVGLLWFLQQDLQKEKIVIYGDSQLVIRQMFNAWKMKAGVYIPYAFFAKELLKFFPNTTGELIKREDNEVADVLSKKRRRKFGNIIQSSVKAMEYMNGKGSRWDNYQNWYKQRILKINQKNHE